MPRRAPLGYDPQGEQLWNLLLKASTVDSVAKQSAAGDDDSVTWLLGDPGEEYLITVLQRPPVELLFHQVAGERNAWGRIARIRAGVTVDVEFVNNSAEDEVHSSANLAPGRPRIVISMRDDVGTWYRLMRPYHNGEVDFGAQFYPAPPVNATNLWVRVEDREALLAEYLVEIESKSAPHPAST